MRLLIACLLLGHFLTCTGVAAREADVSRDHSIVAEDYFTISSLQSIALSPDGSQVAFTELRWDKEADKQTSELWVVDTASRETTRLTFDDVSQGSPSWSPDGHFIYFTSNQKRAGEEKPPYDGKTQVWRIPASGGEMQVLTRVKEGIVSYQLSAAGSTLYYQTTDENVDAKWKELREEFDQLEYGHGVHDFSQIWKLDLKTWRSKKIVDEKRVVRSFQVSPDESKIAMHTTPTKKLISNEGWSRVDLWDAVKNEVITLTQKGWRKGDPSPYGWINEVRFSRDSRALAFTVSFDGHPTQLSVVEWNGGEYALRELACSKQMSLVGGSLAWRGNSRDLVFLGEDRARIRILSIPGVRQGKQGTLNVLTPGDVVVRAFDYSADGNRLAVINHDLENSGDIYTVSASGFKRVTRINPQIDTWKLPQISLVQWTAPDGSLVEGVLELPPDYQQSDGPLPLVVQIHGGPTAATHYQFMFRIYGRTLMASQGYALLSPNYRGSTGYGDQFMVDLIGRENNIEVADILAGVDSLIGRRIADPQRLAVMGWSNGGYLTNCLITKSKRFQAASSGAGVVDQVIQWGTEDTPGHVINYMESLPWTGAGAYRKGSPLYQLNQVKTPTLIHVGEKDARVPPAHARALYRALKHYLHVPTELIVYPGAAHGLTTYQHRLAKMKWDLAWFGKYLSEPAQGSQASHEEAQEANEANE